MDAFLAMGGYAAYVWPAYGASFVVLAGLAAWTFLGLRRTKRRLSELEGRRG